MYIPMTGTLQHQDTLRLPSHARDLPPTRLPQLEYRLQDIVSQAIMVTRFVMIAIGMSTLAGSTAGAQVAIALAIALAVALMAVVYRYDIPYWVRLAGDGAVVALLVTASGGVMSPVLALPVLLIPLGALHGGVRDSIASTCIGIMLLLMIAIYDLPQMSESLAAVLFVQFVTGGAITWLSNRISAAVVCLYTGVQQAMPASTRAETSTERYAHWQRDMMRVVEGEGIAEVLRMGRQVAYDIVGATVDFHISGEPVPNMTDVDGAFLITNSHATQRSVMVVHCSPKMVDRLQYDALAQLLTLVQLRSMTLTDYARHERDQQSMQILWQMAGTHNGSSTLTDVEAGSALCEVLSLRGMALATVASANDIMLDWHTEDDLLGPCDGELVSQLCEAVQLQLMRILPQDDQSYMVLPIQANQAILVVGTVDNEDTQRIVMMFADMVKRFASQEPAVTG